MAHRPREDRRTLPAARVRANELWRIPKPFLVDAQNDATLIAIRAQATAGLDIVTDGEIRLWLWPLAYWALSKGLSGSQNGHSVNLEIPSDVSYRLGVRRECVRQDLDRDLTTERRVRRPIHARCLDGHAALEPQTDRNSDAMMVDAVFKGLAQFHLLNTCIYQGFRAEQADREEARSVKFFVCNNQQWCESHPLRQPVSLCLSKCCQRTSRNC